MVAVVVVVVVVAGLEGEVGGVRGLGRDELYIYIYTHQAQLYAHTSYTPQISLKSHCTNSAYIDI